MGSALYLPFQRLDYYEYKEGNKDLFLISKIQVYLQLGETLVCREKNPSIPMNEFSIELHFDVLSNGTEPVDPFTIETKILIGSNVNYTGVVTDVASKINDIRNQVKKRLTDLKTDFFIVDSRLYLTDGSESGQVTNTIKGDNTIVIV